MRERTEAFTVAEAGLEYYRWFLSHFPGNTTDGTGHGGPYVTTYTDPENGTAGTYSLSIVGNSTCGVVQSIDVTSTGSPSDAPGISSTIVARYAAPSVAAYSYVINSSVVGGLRPRHQRPVSQQRRHAHGRHRECACQQFALGLGLRQQFRLFA